jgi:hypothetical protein
MTVSGQALRAGSLPCGQHDSKGDWQSQRAVVGNEDAAAAGDSSCVSMTGKGIGQRQDAWRQEAETSARPYNGFSPISVPHTAYLIAACRSSAGFLLE